MKKRYLETVEDVLALKDTDTKIYAESSAGHYKFVKGVLCRFNAYVSCYGNAVNPNPMVARKALKEMEGVK